MKYVQQKTEEVSTLTTLQKLGERIDAAEGEETTANGIYWQIGIYCQMSTNTNSIPKDAYGYDAMSIYLPIDGLGINALPDSEKYKRGIKKNRNAEFG
jgi:hypothetical protein